jgi:hypothetical protein
MTSKSSFSSDQYTLDKATADLYINSWKTGRKSIVPTDQPPTETNIQLNAFSFSIQDFKDFVARVDMDPLSNQITGVVCHIGMKPNPIPDGQPPLVPCLIFEALLNYDTSTNPIKPGQCLGELVPLDNAGSDTTPERTSARYDFSYPCPATCPTAEV